MAQRYHSRNEPAWHRGMHIWVVIAALFTRANTACTQELRRKTWYTYKMYVSELYSDTKKKVMYIFSRKKKQKLQLEIFIARELKSKLE